ncbi:MAG TPA: hypothetical protein VIM75_15075 [Ohtaekwangia sp.]|uniref:hypothetical protein n=1 Tax=Ohtaekwangia sp. TaxID=2066019 RepID=UPI002F9503FD
MKLSHTQKIIVCVLTFLPFLVVPYIGFEIFHFVMETIKASETHEPPDSVVITGILSFIIPILLLSMLSLGLHIFYIIHAAMNKAIDQTERIVWILLFVFFGAITFIIYWFLRIRNEKPEAPYL